MPRIKSVEYGVALDYWKSLYLSQVYHNSVFKMHMGGQYLCTSECELIIPAFEACFVKPVSCLLRMPLHISAVVTLLSIHSFKKVAFSFLGWFMRSCAQALS